MSRAREYQSGSKTRLLFSFCRLMEDEDSSICSPSATANWTSLMGYNDTFASHLDREDPWNNLTSSTSLPSNLSIETSSSSQNRMPAAVMIPTGIMLYVLSLLTFVGNAMVLHAIRTDKRLQTVSFYFTFSHLFCTTLMDLSKMKNRVGGLA